MERAEYERLRWRCIRRGLLEVDLALNGFLERGEFEKLDETQRQAFIELANMEDHDLWHWISGQAECNDPRLQPIIAMLRKA